MNNAFAFGIPKSKSMILRNQLELSKCPHCGIDSPNISLKQIIKIHAKSYGGERAWHIYGCARCGGAIAAVSNSTSNFADEIYPKPQSLNEDIPIEIAPYLQEAIDTQHAPRASIVMSAAAIDAMLKTKGLIDGTLYKRIDEAATSHLITEDMAKWAHDIRLDANDQRHADIAAAPPTLADATKCLDFALTFAEILFVLPARVQRGLKSTTTV